MIAIAAITKNGVMGDSSTLSLPWPKQSEDMVWFKEKTTQHNNLLFGRRTWEGMKIKRLPNRNVFVLGRSHVGEPLDSSVKFISSIEEPGYIDFCVCGGREIYQQFIPSCESLYLTVFDFEVEENKNTIKFPFYEKDLHILFDKVTVVKQINGGVIKHYELQ